jgi:hypothetical protein
LLPAASLVRAPVRVQEPEQVLEQVLELELVPDLGAALVLERVTTQEPKMARVSKTEPGASHPLSGLAQSSELPRASRW